VNQVLGKTINFPGLISFQQLMAQMPYKTYLVEFVNISFSQ